MPPAIAQGEPELANQILLEIEGAPPALADRVAEATEARERERQAQRELASHLDRGVGVGARQIWVLVYGALWIGNIAHAGLLVPDVLWPNAIALTVGTITGLIAPFRRRALLIDNRLNRLILSQALATVGATAVLFFAAPMLGLATLPTLTVAMLFWLTGIALGAVNIERRAGWIVAMWAILFVLSCVKPQWAGVSATLGAILQSALFFVINRSVKRADGGRSQPS